MNTRSWQIDATHLSATSQVNVPPRLLLGPGPSNAHPRVLQALAMRQVSHLDPAFIGLMDDVQALLRYTWQTDNQWTIAVSGTGTAAMEAAVANIVEPDDVVLVGVMGYFGERLVDMATRYGADVRVIEKGWGMIFSHQEIRDALEKHRPAVLMLVHAETSTGALQPINGIGALCREFDCLLLTDSVTSLGAAPLFLDEWQVDVAYSCSQKGLGCPPGASPLTFGPRAVAKMEKRRTAAANWYLDMALLRKYWFGETRGYHHTMSSNMIYALREGLRLVAEEGLQERWLRHQDNAILLWEGLRGIGLDCHVTDPGLRIPSLTTVCVPDGVDAKEVTHQLLHDYNIEIAGGFSKLAGRVWRVGLMGFNSRPENVMMLLAAMDQIINH